MGTFNSSCWKSHFKTSELAATSVLFKIKIQVKGFYSSDLNSHQSRQ